MAGAALVVVATAWLSEIPDITAAEATEAAEAAFEAAGLSAVIDGEPTASSYASSSVPEVEVWTVRATVRSSPITLLLARSGAQPVQIDDRAANGQQYVLSEVEYGALAEHIEDPALDRILARNITLTVAAVPILGMVLALGLTDHLTKERR